MLAEAVKGFSGDTQIPQSNNMGVSGFLKVGGGGQLSPLPLSFVWLWPQREVSQTKLMETMFRTKLR